MSRTPAIVVPEGESGDEIICSIIPQLHELAKGEKRGNSK